VKYFKIYLNKALIILHFRSCLGSLPPLLHIHEEIVPIIKRTDFLNILLDFAFGLTIPTENTR
jgi:hypothetical protein